MTTAPERYPPPAAGNPFMDRDVVATYERWYQTVGRRADHLEKALLGKLIRRFPGTRNVLEVGCGTGHFTRWLASRGLETAGLDISPAMLAEARRLGTGLLIEGNASSLPFAVGRFDVVAMITTLEFLPRPLRALEEALRVARKGVVLGVLNRCSRQGRKLRSQGGPIWDAAHLFTPAELVGAVEEALAGRAAALFRRTTLWPCWPRDLPLPWGGFIGMAVRPSE